MTDKKTGKMIAMILGALGLLLILAGPAFHFIDTKIGIFLALASWIIGIVVRGFSKIEDDSKVESKETKEELKEKD